MTESQTAPQTAVVAIVPGQLRRSRVLWWGIAAGAALIATAMVAVALGPTGVPLREVFSALLGHSGGGVTERIVLEVRLPRVMAAVLCGASLALAGALLQAAFGNPLVDASLVGVAPIAGVGALVSGAVFGTQQVSGAAIGAAVVSVITLLALTRVTTSGLRFVLVGVAFGAVGTAVLGVLVSIPATAGGRSIAAWVFGSLALADSTRVLVLAAALLLGVLLIGRGARALDIACLGESPARRLGVDVPRARRRWLLAVAVLVAPSVSMFGVVGFIGLAVPHVLRLAGLRAHRFLLPASAVTGAWLLLVADTAARTVVKAAEVPVSFVLALIGAPLLMRATLRGARD